MRTERRADLLVLVSVLGLVLLAHGGALRAWFSRDDFVWLMEARRGLSWRSFGYLRPVSCLWFYGQQAAFGLEPAGYHAANLALHAWNALWLYALGRAALGTRLAPAIAAIAFAVAGRAAGTVHWVSGIVDLLPLALALPALWAQLRFLRGGGVGFFVSAQIGVALALFAKESGLVLVVLVALMELMHTGPRAALRLRVLSRYLPLLLVCVGWYLCLGESVAEMTQRGGGVQLDLVVAATRVSQLIAEVLLAPVALEGGSLGIWVAPVVLLVLLALPGVFEGRAGLRRALALSLVLLVLLLPLFPVAVLNRSSLPGRYLYAPLAASTLLVGHALVCLRKQGHAAGLGALGVALWACLAGAFTVRSDLAGDRRIMDQGNAAAEFVASWGEFGASRFAKDRRVAVVGVPVESHRQFAGLAEVFLGIEAERVDEVMLDLSRPRVLDTLRDGGAPAVRELLQARDVLYFNARDGVLRLQPGQDSRDGFMEALGQPRREQRGQPSKRWIPTVGP